MSHAESCLFHSALRHQTTMAQIARETTFFPIRWLL